MAIDLYWITARINERLGMGGYPGGSVDAPDSISWDVSFGNLKFLFATSDQDPYLRETSEFRRERIDTATNPGEQSLDSGYWVRSQESWHYGAGLRNAEPLEITAAEYRFRYQDSGGVDPWTAGQLTLLNDTERILKDPESFSLLGTTEGVVLYNAAGVTLLDDAGGTIWQYENPSIYSLTTDGENFYAGTTDGKVVKGDLETGSASDLHDFTTGDNALAADDVLVRWVKGRIIACVGTAVWEGAGTVWTEVDPWYVVAGRMEVAGRSRRADRCLPDGARWRAVQPLQDRGHGRGGPGHAIPAAARSGDASGRDREHHLLLRRSIPRNRNIRWSSHRVDGSQWISQCRPHFPSER